MHHTLINDKPYSEELLEAMRTDSERGIVTTHFDNNPTRGGYWSIKVPFDPNYKQVSNETDYRNPQPGPWWMAPINYFTKGKEVNPAPPVRPLSELGSIFRNDWLDELVLLQSKQKVRDANWDVPNSSSYKGPRQNFSYTPTAKSTEEQVEQVIQRFTRFTAPDFIIDRDSLVAIQMWNIPRKDGIRVSGDEVVKHTYEMSLNLCQYRGESGSPGVLTFFNQTIRAKTVWPNR